MRETLLGKEYWVGSQNGLHEWDLDPFNAWRTCLETTAKEFAERTYGGQVVTLTLTVGW